MSNHKLIVENWRRFLKEEEEKTLEEGGGLVAAFMALVGMSQPQDMQGVEVNGQNYTIEQVAQAHKNLGEFNTKGEDEERYVDKAQQELVDIVKVAITMDDDPDNDGYYGDGKTIKNFKTIKYKYEVGEAYANMALERQASKSKPDAEQDTRSPFTAPNAEMPKDLQVKIGKSPQGTKKLVIKFKPQADVLSPEVLNKIATENGIKSYKSTQSVAKGIAIIVQADQ